MPQKKLYQPSVTLVNVIIAKLKSKKSGAKKLSFSLRKALNPTRLPGEEKGTKRQFFHHIPIKKTCHFYELKEPPS